jgi:enoyl-CoA hydratase/carnithine racemase
LFKFNLFYFSDKLAEVEKEIEKNLPIDPVESRKYIKEILDRYQSISTKPDTNSSPFIRHKEAIQRCFGEDITSIEQILELLHEEELKNGEHSEWASKTKNSFLKMSPTSLKITLAQLIRGRNLDLGECIKMEFRMILRCISENDFKEGVRALLIDKDNTPYWQPSKLDEVPPDLVNKYFQPLEERELIIS